MKMLHQIGLSVVCAGVALLSGCAQIPEGSGQNPDDPWETLNRHTYQFNEQVDSLVIRPVAKTYKKVVPEYARDRIYNVFVNLDEPANTLNNALQGKGEATLASVFRFLINTTLGLGGLYDVAGTVGGQPVRDEDFGQTLAVWGVPQGPYLVIPFMGPSTIRDGVGLGVGYFSEPMTYTDGGWIEWGMWGTVALEVRTRMLPATDLLKDSVDPYVMAREGYLANRKNVIWDGNPPFEFPKDEFEDEDVVEPQANETNKSTE